MADTALYVLAGYDSVTEAAITARQELIAEKGFTGTQTKGIPPHITLGIFPSPQESQLIDLCRQVAADTAPFPVTFAHIGVFQGGRVLFLAPDTSHELLYVKERFGDSAGWTAHTTLLIDEQEIILSAIPTALQDFSMFTGQVEKLYVYEFFPARLILTLPLQGKGINQR